MGTNVAWSGVERRATAVRPAAEEMETGSMAQAVAGGAAVVLAILALIGLLPDALASIAGIALGAGLLVGAAAMAGRITRVAGTAEPAWAHHGAMGGLGMEAMAGLAAIVLGILAVLGADPGTLLNCAAIALGAGMILASGSLLRLEEMTRRAAAQAKESAPAPTMYMSGSTEALVGGGTMVLGIIGLAGHAPIILASVAFLSLGAIAVVSASAVATRMFTLLS
jgi:hypothetical protein